MILSPTPPLSQRVRLPLSASVALLLLCGVIVWAGVTSRDTGASIAPLVSDRAEQHLITVNSEHLRVRPSTRKGSVVGDSQGNNDHTDEPYAAFLSTTNNSDYRSFPSTSPTLALCHFPILNRYQLPVPRDPPTA